MRRGPPESPHDRLTGFDTPEIPFVRAAGKWVPLVLKPSALSAATTLATFLGLSALYRTLPKNQAGTLALLLALLEILAIFAAHGMPTLVTRRYSAEPPGAFNWRHDLVRTVVVAALPILGGILLLGRVFSFEPVLQVYLLAGSLAVSALNTVSYMLNSQGHHSWSSALIRLPNTFFLPAAAGTLLWPGQVSLPAAIGLHLLGILAVLTLALLVMNRLYRAGAQRISLRERGQGLIFLLTIGSVTMPESALLAVAGALVLPAELAAFAAVAILLRPYKLLRSILSMVITPRFVKQPRAPLRQAWLVILGLSGIAVVGTVLLVPPLARWFYEGRYDSGLAFIPFLALQGALNLLTVLPNSYLIARGEPAFINRFTFARAAMVLGAVLLGAIAIARFQLIGLAAGMVLVEVVSLAASQIYLRRFRLSTARSTP